MSYIQHIFTESIVCPHCGREYDAPNNVFCDDEGLPPCDMICTCGGEFTYTQDTAIVYTTRKKCKGHIWKITGKHVMKQHFTTKNRWQELPQSEWTYHRCDQCEYCGEKNFEKITESEFYNLL